MSQEASARIDKHIAGFTDWRGKQMARLRKVINSADPSLKEEWKWDIPLWSSNGNVCAIGAFKDHIKINFFKGASLADPHHLFNGGLEAKASRSIDLSQSDTVDEAALKQLVRAAVARNKTKS
ncbi:MAG: DUF1801 domain-containing protein [Chloroflexi bacterium]|nr:MAG: DUF1801 domain-containing protein [Chloroflexota bacterium]